MGLVLSFVGAPYEVSPATQHLGRLRFARKSNSELISPPNAEPSSGNPPIRQGSRRQAHHERRKAAVARVMVDRSLLQLLAQPPVRLAERVVRQTRQQMV